MLYLHNGKLTFGNRVIAEGLDLTLDAEQIEDLGRELSNRRRGIRWTDDLSKSQVYIVSRTKAGFSLFVERTLDSGTMRTAVYVPMGGHYRHTFATKGEAQNVLDAHLENVRARLANNPISSRKVVGRA